MSSPRAERRGGVVGAAVVALAVLALPLAAQAPTDEGPTLAVRAGTLLIGTGEVLHDAVMIVRDGRIEALGAGRGAPAIPDGATVVDASDKVVMPGLVAADSDLAAERDTPYNVTPDFVAVDGFDFVRERPHLLSGGITTVYLSPARGRLIAGQGSVVKLFGDDVGERVVAESASLRLTMSAAATKSPDLFEPTPAPTSDNPLLPARKQLPSARISMLPVLRKLFADAEAEGPTGTDGHGADDHGPLVGDGSSENQYTLTALRDVARGTLPLRISAQEAQDIRRALLLSKELGAHPVLEDPWEIGKVLQRAAQDQAAAVFRLPVRLNASNPGGEDLRQLDEPARPRLSAPAEAVKAGLRVALAAADDDDTVELLVLAALAVRNGMTKDQALRAVTTDAAAILGVQDRVGSLQTGKDADFLVLSGEPLAIGTLVEQTFVGGKLAYRRDSKTDVLAVRAGKIHTLAGQTYHDGVLIAENGKIKAIGEDLAVPYGAQVIDLGRDSVMVPGFIDAYSHVGLSGEGSGVPQGSPDQQVADVVRFDDPLLRQAARAGLTTVLVSGVDGGPVSGRVAALKTGATDHASMVVADTAALRFVHDSLGADALKPLEQQLERGKKYLEAWQKYEKAKEDFEKGKREKPPEEAAPKPTETTADPVSGSWAIEPENAPIPLKIALELKLEGTTVTGTVQVDVRGRQVGPLPVQNGTFHDGSLAFDVSMPPTGDGHVDAKVDNDAMTGTLSGGPMALPFKGTRVAKPGAGGEPVATGAGESSEPKKPQVDESLEPFKALLEKRIPAVVRADKAPAIEAVVALFEKEGVRLVLTGAKDATKMPGVLGEAGHRPGVVLGPDIVEHDGMKVENAAAELSDAGVTIALATGDTAGSRFLPLHAAMAVRYGLDPATALAAITKDPAEMFGISDRVGSLERGKDADFVVFSGAPFDVTSRVQLVVVNGKVVVDQRDSQ